MVDSSVLPQGSPNLDSLLPSGVDGTPSRSSPLLVRGTQQPGVCLLPVDAVGDLPSPVWVAAMDPAVSDAITADVARLPWYHRTLAGYSNAPVPCVSRELVLDCDVSGNHSRPWLFLRQRLGPSVALLHLGGGGRCADLCVAFQLRYLLGWSDSEYSTMIHGVELRRAAFAWLRIRKNRKLQFWMATDVAERAEWSVGEWCQTFEWSGERRLSFNAYADEQLSYDAEGKVPYSDGCFLCAVANCFGVIVEVWPWSSGCCGPTPTVIRPVTGTAVLGVVRLLNDYEGQHFYAVVPVIDGSPASEAVTAAVAAQASAFSAQGSQSGGHPRDSFVSCEHGWVRCTSTTALSESAVSPLCTRPNCVADAQMWHQYNSEALNGRGSGGVRDPPPVVPPQADSEAHAEGSLAAAVSRRAVSVTSVGAGEAACDNGPHSPSPNPSLEVTPSARADEVTALSASAHPRPPRRVLPREPLLGAAQEADALCHFSRHFAAPIPSHRRVAAGSVERFGFPPRRRDCLLWREGALPTLLQLLCARRGALRYTSILRRGRLACCGTISLGAPVHVQ